MCVPRRCLNNGCPFQTQIRSSSIMVCVWAHQSGAIILIYIYIYIIYIILSVMKLWLVSVTAWLVCGRSTSDKCRSLIRESTHAWFSRLCVTALNPMRTHPRGTTYSVSPSLLMVSGMCDGYLRLPFVAQNPSESRMTMFLLWPEVVVQHKQTDHFFRRLVDGRAYSMEDLNIILRLVDGPFFQAPC